MTVLRATGRYPWLALLALALWPGPALAVNPLSRSGYAEVMQFALPLAALAGSAAIGDWQGVKQLTASGVVTVALTEGLKHGVDASRPNGQGHDAFPSGHTATAFAGTSYIHYRYGGQWGLPAELAAAGVAYARVGEGEHRWRDVAGAAVIAHLSSFVWVDARNDNVVVMPLIGGKKNSFGVLIKLGF